MQTGIGFVIVIARTRNIKKEIKTKYWIIFIGIAVISWIVQSRFKNRFKTYSEFPLSAGVSGAEIGQTMLHENGIYGVKVLVANEGGLSDHYNRAHKTVNLSNEVYYGRSVEAAAVA